MTLAIYLNVTDMPKGAIREAKARIRARIHSEGGKITAIYRNPFSPERHRYRFLRVHFKQGQS